jgi:hypothetical protein
MAMAHKLAARAGLAAGIYGCWVRPRLMRWGATEEEVAGPYPHAELIPEGKRSPTMAVTIGAPPERVWPWLVQIGWDRGGWYSWDRLDNAGRPSATDVHSEWQDVAVGDQLSFWALGRRMDAYRVGVLEPSRFFGLYGYSDLRGRWLDPDKPRPAAYMEAIWGFLLNELPGGRTRLVVSGYQTFRPRWIERFAAEWLLLPVSWIMQARMLAVLKRNIERAANAQPLTVTESPDGPAQPEHPSATPEEPESPRGC